MGTPRHGQILVGNHIRKIILVSALLFSQASMAGGDVCKSSMDADIIQCDANKRAIQEKRLEEVFSQATAEASKQGQPQVKKLNAVRTAWSAFRDKYCTSYVSSIEIVPGSPFLASWQDQCIARVTSQFVDNLKEDFLSDKK